MRQQCGMMISALRRAGILSGASARRWSGARALPRPVAAAMIQCGWSNAETAPSPGVTRGAIGGCGNNIASGLRRSAAAADLRNRLPSPRRAELQTVLNAQLWGLNWCRRLHRHPPTASTRRLPILTVDPVPPAWRRLSRGLHGYVLKIRARTAAAGDLRRQRAIYAAGAVASLASATASASRRPGRRRSRSTVPGIAGLRNGGLRLLRHPAAAIIIIAPMRVVDEPRIVGRDVVRTPIFNGCSMDNGVPVALFWYAAIAGAGMPMICRRAWPRQPAILFMGLVVLFIHQTTGDVFRHRWPCGNCHAGSVGFAMAIGSTCCACATNSVVHNAGVLLIFVANLPATLLNWLSWRQPTSRSTGRRSVHRSARLWHSGAAAATRAHPGTHQILADRADRRTYGRRVGSMHPDERCGPSSMANFMRGATDDAEQHDSRSAGVASRRHSWLPGCGRAGRPASRRVVVLTIGKVSLLFDMSDLTVFRVLSFDGLGARRWLASDGSTSALFPRAGTL